MNGKTNGNPQLQRTRNYSQFSFTKENRSVDVLNMSTAHRKLRASMEKYGFLPSFPITVSSRNGRFPIIDGQHRFTFARELGLEVYFVVVDLDIDVAEINAAQCGWSMRDFANRWKNHGVRDYQTGLEFSEHYGMPIGISFAMLSGTSVFNNIREDFREGNFRVSHSQIASRVGSIYKSLCAIKRGMRHDNLISAIWACCHVEYFKERRLIETAGRKPDLLKSCGTRESWLQMIHEIYNYQRQTRESLAFDANEAMRQRGGRSGSENAR
jgi:hypothetical protein